MRLKKVLLLMLVFTLISAATIWANDTYERFSGKRVTVYVNDKEIKSSGLLMQHDGRVMLPLRDIAGALQSLVKWDGTTQTVHIFKPNVHIFLSTMNKDGSFGTFGKVAHKQKHDFFIFSQIDSLASGIHSIKFDILDPTGKRVYEHEHLLNGQNDDVLWVRTPNIRLEFAHQGEYKVMMFMKLEEGDSYQLVSEKVFHSN